MQYSPKLKKAMQEIKAILDKNDIAGFVVIHTPGFSEYLNRIDPTYSGAKMNPKGDICFRIKSAEVGKEKAKELANDTVNMFTHMAKAIGEHAMLYLQTEKFLCERYDVQQFPGEQSSETEQNN